MFFSSATCQLIPDQVLPFPSLFLQLNLPGNTLWLTGINFTTRGLAAIVYRGLSPKLHIREKPQAGAASLLPVLLQTKPTRIREHLGLRFDQ